MGVATYQLATQLPEQYSDVLPDAETLKKNIVKNPISKLSFIGMR